MAKSQKKPGLVSIKLKTGLSRGNDKYVAGQVVEVGPGLGNRLVDRGQAIFEGTDAKRVKAKKATATAPAKAATTTAKIETTVTPPKGAATPAKDNAVPK